MLWEFLKTSFIFIFVIAVIVLCGVAIVRSINYIEENTHAVKGRIQTIVYTAIALHAYMLVAGMPIWHVLFSLSIQYAFNCFFEVYPTVKPEDPKFIYGVVGSLVNHFLLIRLFINQNSGIFTVATFFLIIWSTPFCFFFTMSASEDALFTNGNKRQVKTYVGMALEWMLNYGRKTISNKGQ